MGFSDFLGEVTSEVQSNVSDINSYIQDQANPVLTAVGLPPAGNLNALDIANGIRGAVAPTAKAGPQASNLAKSTAFGFSLPAVGAISGSTLLILGVAAYFLLSGKKGRI